MNKALVTFAKGEQYEELLKLSLPTFEHFAELHEYEIIVGNETQDERRPHWNKVPMILKALDHFEYVLWIDADAQIIRPERDIIHDLHPDDFQGIVSEKTEKGLYANTGVWLMRQDEESFDFLEDVWRCGDVEGSRWHDQGAFLKVLGWVMQPGPVKPVHGSSYLARTGWLPQRWNNSYRNPSSFDPSIMHYCGSGHAVRLREMTKNLLADKRRESRAPATCPVCETAIWIDYCLPCQEVGLRNVLTADL